MFFRTRKLRREVEELIKNSVLLSNKRKSEFLSWLKYLKHPGLVKMKKYLEGEGKFIIKALPKKLEKIKNTKSLYSDLRGIITRKSLKELREEENRAEKKDKKNASELLDLL